MKKTVVAVTQQVEVWLDEEKFTPEFIAEFRQSFFPFFDMTDHAEHIAQLHARGVYGGGDSEFIEGYGIARDMGISASVVETEVEVDSA